MLTLSVRGGGLNNMALLHQDPDTYEIDPEIALGIKIHYISQATSKTNLSNIKRVRICKKLMNYSVCYE